MVLVLNIVPVLKLKPTLKIKKIGVNVTEPGLNIVQIGLLHTVPQIGKLQIFLFIILLGSTILGVDNLYLLNLKNI